MPKRIQRRRTRGWRMPEGAVYVGRPTKWGNPFKLATPEQSAAAYRECLTGYPVSQERLAKWREAGGDPALAVLLALGVWNDQIRGRDLACWCPIISCGAYVPCHADVLLSIANDIPMDEVIRENTRRAEGQALR